MRKTLENNWSRAVLAHQIEADLYERQGKAVSNFAATLPVPQSDLAQEITKDPYQFDFLTIRERFDERELKDALMDNITTFLLELGTGFAFVGREYRIQVGSKERFIDMLFYHIRLRCYVVLEVKVTDFEPAYMGQLGTYVVAVNHQLRTEGDNPTIGLLVCKSLDKVEAQYALEATSQPIGVSGYELAKLIPEDFKGSLPTIEEIEKELGGAQ
jgi:predicted nuclease of restriction endonuclease-like (RecB) superfamily